ncbi:hypothetical protein CVT25_001350 [Psilocybe cyanescens]|uniref:Uncharacterized protein n=1 Tax=Psilocybe cyanescens TaxID=93625 RepID=A0A409XES5_PSICY|nr:hypothetical protein CVT25_001350 [Psilocybe cyanescens]
MFASRFFVSFLAFTALSVSATPVEVEERQTADLSSILAVVSVLQGKTQAILPEINSLVSSGSASEDTLTPLISGLVSSLTTASSSLSSIGSVGTTSSGSASEVASAIAPIVSEITSTLGGAQTAVPGLSTVIAGFGLDAALNQVLTGLEVLVAGVLNVVSTL